MDWSLSGSGELRDLFLGRRGADDIAEARQHLAVSLPTGDVFGPRQHPFEENGLSSVEVAAFDQ